MNKYLIISVMIALFVAIFTIQNIDNVSIQLFAWEIQGSLSLVMLICFGAGVLTALLMSMPSNYRKNHQISDLKKQIKELNSAFNTVKPTEEPKSEEKKKESDAS